MPVPFKLKAVRIGTSIRVTIPKEVCDYLKIEAGDMLQLTVTDGQITISPAKKR